MSKLKTQIESLIAINEDINVANADVNEKIRQALQSTKRSKPDNSDLLDELGITYRKIQGATGWELTGPNGKTISYEHATSKQNERIAGIAGLSWGTYRNTNRSPNRYEARDRAQYEKTGVYKPYKRGPQPAQELKKVDYLTLLTEKDSVKPKQQYVRAHNWDWIPVSDQEYENIQARSRYKEIRKDNKKEQQRGSIYYSVGTQSLSTDVSQADRTIKQLEQAIAKIRKEIEAIKEKDVPARQELRDIYAKEYIKYGAHKHKAAPYNKETDLDEFILGNKPEEKD